MIKLAIISPVKALQFSALGDIELLLPHLYFEHQEYRDYFQAAKKIGRFVIMDNSVIELGTAISASDLVELAKKFYPNVVVAPDVFGDGPATVKRVEEFLQEFDRGFPNGGGPEIMAVAQGRHFNDFMDCYNVLVNHPRIGKIGIPFGLRFQIPDCEYDLPTEQDAELTSRMLHNRIYIMDFLNSHELLKKPIHLLGLADGVELLFQSRYPQIESNDSSSAVALALRGHTYSKVRGLFPNAKPTLNHLASVPEEAIPLIRKNVEILKYFARGQRNGM